MKHLKTSIFAAIAFVAALSSCGDDTYTETLETQRLRIAKAVAVDALYYNLVDSVQQTELRALNASGASSKEYAIFLTKCEKNHERWGEIIVKSESWERYCSEVRPTIGKVISND